MFESFIAVEGMPKNYFKLQLFLLKIGGISLSTNESFGYKIYSVFVLYFILSPYPFVAFNDLFKHEFAEFSRIVVYFFGTFEINLIIVVAYFNRKKLGVLLQKLEQEPFLTSKQRGGDEEEKLMNWWISFNQKQGLVYFLGAGLVYLYPVLLTFITRLRSNDYHDWAFGFGSITILNVTYSPNYEILWMYQNMVMFYVAINGCSLILLLAGVPAFISLQFKILQNNLRRLVLNSYHAMLKDTEVSTCQTSTLSEIDASTIPWKYLKISLKEAVCYHLNILDLAADFEEIFNKTILSMYLCTVLLVCFEVYRISLLSVSDASIVMVLVETAGVSCLSLLICYGGQQMTNESFDVSQAAYEAYQVGVDLRFQKGLILIMKRSQKPLVIKAGKFIETSMITYLWIVRTAYSTCMVLRNVRQE